MKARSACSKFDIGAEQGKIQYGQLLEWETVGLPPLALLLQLFEHSFEVLTVLVKQYK
jgi:hypothetical protein